VTNFKDNTVTELRIATAPIRGNPPQCVAFDGANLWVANYSGNNVTKSKAPKPTDGPLLGTFNVGTIPLGVAFGGVNIKIPNAVANGTVSKMWGSKNVYCSKSRRKNSSRSSG
jgi:DNA-binding beta-propeller fold protein YncE